MYVRFTELSLAELLDDPLVRLVMASDGVDAAAFRRLIQAVRWARRARQIDDVRRAADLLP